MGMTLDKAVDRLEDLHFEQDDWEYGELTEDCSLNRDALRLAIDTMRKYQKIEKIIDDWNNQKINNIICCLDVKEVIEDGKEKIQV